MKIGLETSALLSNGEKLEENGVKCCSDDQLPVWGLEVSKVQWRCFVRWAMF